MNHMRARRNHPASPAIRGRLACASTLVLCAALVSHAQDKALEDPPRQEVTRQEAVAPEADAAEADASEAGAAQPVTVKELTDLDLETLMEIEVTTVSAAARYEQPIASAPASVTVITADQIRKLGYRTLAEILSAVPGLYISSDRNYEYIGLRGFSRPGDFSSRLLLLIDGHRFNDNVYDTASSGYNFAIDVDLIERVEIIRGPGSALYGSNAFFGVIDVITRKGSSFSTAEAAAKVGSFDTYKARLTYGDVIFKDLDIILSGSYYSSAGQTHFYREFNDPSTNFGIARNNDYQVNFNYFAKAKYKDFEFEGAYNWRDKQLPTAPYGTTFNNDDTHTIDAQGFARLKYSRDFIEELSFMASVSYNDYYYRGEYAYDDPAPIINKDTTRGRWVGGEAILSTRLVPRNFLMAGLELKGNFQQDQRNYDSAVYLDDKRENFDWGVFIQDDISLLDSLSLSVGCRYDRYETFGDTLNPRAAVIYKPCEPTTIRFFFGKAFRAPSIYELYYDDGGVIQKNNPGLDPERITTYEFALDQKITESFTLTGSIYYYHIDDLITEVVDPVDGLAQFRNTGNVEARGLEFSFNARLPHAIRAQASYALQEAEDEDGRVLSNSPMHLAKLQIIAPVLHPKVHLGLDARYMSSRKTVSRSTLNDFFIVNLTLFGHEIAKGLDFSVSVYNLFNHKYADPVSNALAQDAINQDGRSFWTQLNFRF